MIRYYGQRQIQPCFRATSPCVFLLEWLPAVSQVNMLVVLYISIITFRSSYFILFFVNKIYYGPALDQALDRLRVAGRQRIVSYVISDVSRWVRSIMIQDSSKAEKSRCSPQRHYRQGVPMDFLIRFSDSKVSVYCYLMPTISLFSCFSCL